MDFQLGANLRDRRFRVISLKLCKVEGKGRNTLLGIKLLSLPEVSLGPDLGRWPHEAARPLEEYHPWLHRHPMQD
jgi:hypothetical protein